MKPTRCIEVSVSKFPGQPSLYDPQNHTHVWKRRLLYLEAKGEILGGKYMDVRSMIAIDIVRQRIENLRLDKG
jgi:hypothetical protein